MLSLVLKALTKADILNKRRFASISIKNCFADVKENDDLFGRSAAVAETLALSLPFFFADVR